MKQGRNRLSLFIAAVLLPLLAGPAAWADDTDLFIASFDPAVTGAQPNILLIMDTSGSMTNPVITQQVWNPAMDFDGCYDRNAFYFATSNTPPPCGSNDYFWKDNNFCFAAENGLANVGQYTDGFKAWRGNTDRWVLLNGDRKNRRVDCQADQGVHGETEGDSARWIVEGLTGPWSSDQVDLASFGTTYTIFDGNWLNWNSGTGTVETTRIQVIKDVTTQLVNSWQGVNVGLMRFNRNEFASQSGGPVIAGLNDVDNSRDNLLTQIAGLPASGWTPLSETLYEAGQYFAGRAVDMGNNGPGVFSAAEVREGGDPSGANYEAPSTFQCQKNYIIMLTDGAPTRDTDANSKIQALPGFSSLIGSCDGSGQGACLDDMADYLHNYDIDPSLPGDQTVNTYTIGFAVDLPILKSTAERGGGEYRLADDTASLSAVLTQIVDSILDDATTFTSPSVPVNAFNRTRNLDDVFVSVFEPSQRVHWPGNLKKYKLQNGVLVGQNSEAAVDPITGFFSDTSWSFWSDDQDGDLVPLGGAAMEQPAWQTRNVYSNILSGVLNAGGNQVVPQNGLLTSAMISTPSGERDQVIEWLRGKDILDSDDDDDFEDDRHMMGDPLHVRPITLTYGGDPSLGTVDATVFISTNDGFLHAIDTNDGSERWSFMPSRLLKRVYDLYSDPIVPNRRYGLDGDIAGFIANDDGQPGITGSERAFLVFGMRRGGDAMFGMEVTNPNDPRLLWEIDSSSVGYEDLGQTWSRAHIDRVNIGGTYKDVVIVGGGYDDSQDQAGYREDQVGNAIYMIDLLTGDLIWSAGPGDAVRNHDLVLNDMTHSIPSGIKVVDLTGDDIPDRMYVGDMGGQVWRFDILNGNSVSELVEGGLIASLGGAAMEGAVPMGDVRRFYAPPDVVAVLKEEPEESYLSVNIGSGFRAAPNESSTNDEFFSVRDFNVFGVIDTDDYQEPVLRDELPNITNNLTPTLLPTDPGWRLSMVQSPGEKVLTESFTFAGEVFFTSFSPGTTDVCSAAKGTNRLYRVRVEDGAPPPPIDDPYEPPDEPEDRFTLLKQGGIAPDAVFFFPDDQEGDPILCIGAECLDPGFDENALRTYWFQDETQ